jgi:hypothetical protein
VNLKLLLLSVYNKSTCGGVLIAFSGAVSRIGLNLDLKYFEECVWMGVATTGYRNLLIGNHCPGMISHPV